MPKKLSEINFRPVTSPYHTIMQHVLCGSWTRTTRTKIQEIIFKVLDEVKQTNKITFHGAAALIPVMGPTQHTGTGLPLEGSSIGSHWHPLARYSHLRFLQHRFYSLPPTRCHSTFYALFNISNFFSLFGKQTYILNFSLKEHCKGLSISKFHCSRKVNFVILNCSFVHTNLKMMPRS